GSWPALNWFTRSSKASLVCPRASARTPSMYGITCSLHERWTYLQQIQYFGSVGMAHPHSLRHPLFRRRWFTDEVIITCLRSYLRFSLCYREVEELLAVD